MFHNVYLPNFISIFAIGSTEFDTSISIAASGREIRKSDKSIARKRYFFKKVILSLDQFEEFNSFFCARAGRLFSFRLSDHSDNKIENQLISDERKNNRVFRLFKRYDDKLIPYKRFITKPVESSVKLYLEGNQNIEIAKVDYDQSLIWTKTNITKDQKLYASCKFDIPVRFNQDSFNYVVNQDGTISLDDIELIEVYE